MKVLVIECVVIETMSRQELANAIGVSLERIVSFERGFELPTEMEMLKISKTLEVHWDKIIFP